MNVNALPAILSDVASSTRTRSIVFLRLLRHLAASGYQRMMQRLPGGSPRTRVAPATPAVPVTTHATALPSSPLHQPALRPHAVQNVNQVLARNQAQAGFNARLAVLITKNVGTMQCAYAFAFIGVGSLVGIVTGSVVLAAVCGSVSSYFLQLVLLPIISVGQEQMSQHQEMQSEEQFKATMNTLHDAEQMTAHLTAQDAELLKHTEMLDLLVQHLIAQQPSVSSAAPSSPAPASPPTRPRRAARRPDATRPAPGDAQT